MSDVSEISTIKMRSMPSYCKIHAEGRGWINDEMGNSVKAIKIKGLESILCAGRGASFRLLWTGAGSPSFLWVVDLSF